MKLNEYIIEKVRNREACLKNDGTIEQLRKVIKTIFPHDWHIPSDLYNYCAASRYINDKWVFYTKPPTNTVISIKSLFDHSLIVEEKKIIGYKAPYDINSHVKKGTIYVKEEKGLIGHYNYVVSGKRSKGSEFYLPKQIVETWEPVYEEEFKLPKINGYEGTIKNNKIIYGCAHLSKKWFNSSENRHIKSMVLSSGVEINENQMNQIRKYLDNFK